MTLEQCRHHRVHNGAAPSHPFVKLGIPLMCVHFAAKQILGQKKSRVSVPEHVVRHSGISDKHKTGSELDHRSVPMGDIGQESKAVTTIEFGYARQRKPGVRRSPDFQYFGHVPPR
jgi:hypothetical protein